MALPTATEAWIWPETSAPPQEPRYSGPSGTVMQRHRRETRARCSMSSLLSQAVTESTQSGSWDSVKRRWAAASHRGNRIYDEAVRQALIVVWEAADRICGKRLKAALPSMVESLERHGHLDLDPDVRERLFSASAATIDRLLRPVRERARGRRRLRRRRKMGSRVPVRTFTDWNEPGPGYLEIDLVAHGGGIVTGAFIHSLVVTDVSSG